MAQDNVASLIRDLRNKKGESLRSAARNIGVDAAHLARIESGQRQISNSLSDRVSDYYDVDPDEVHLAAGRLPPDIVDLLLSHPEEFPALRDRLRPHA